ncbi:LacI family DNA-binding transcriptional regulator [Alicyclobacillus fastidiosus]|uniref:LacI family DNA-binding transcriptional regulator n=2 Tax=Alicyclobacillus fastidiosus TaxID=392011 RepID=A0ABV5AK07_9BACL|nr:LacI family DNA-binding transcriptional regulator [Alicyclobacillus fastidiosus]WEH09063.1 LacI family DNA-binding transcriptional regulator [Alicyclobacillus fastidiosus]
MATMADVAKLAGVSVMTVSRIINGSGTVKESTRKRVLRAMEEMNYVPKGYTKQVIQHEISTLVLIVPDITNPFFTFIARGMEDVAKKQGYRVFLANTDENINKEKQYIQMCIEFHADGVLIAPVGDDSKANLELLDKQGIPFVLIDREVEGVQVDVVKSDIIGCSRALVEHLIELGHRRIAVVTGPSNNRASRERVEGYLQALERNHLVTSEEFMKRSTMTRDIDPKFIDELLNLEEPPTAMFVANMFQYAHAVRRLGELGLRIPEDMSIVGFGNSDYLAAIDSAFTSAIQPTYSFGSLGTQMLIERIEGLHEMPRRIVLEGDIVIRRSTAPIL